MTLQGYMNINLKHALIAVLLVMVFSLNAQEKPDSRFLFHLSSKALNKEVIFLTNDINFKIYSQSLKDSLHYIRGWSLYAEKSLLLSSKTFMKVTPNSPFYHKSRFFTGYNYTYLNDYKSAKSVLNNIEHANTELEYLKNFQRAGISLLERDYQKFHQYIEKPDTSYYAISEEIKKLNIIAENLKNHKKKSPWMAGIMSALIPGSGKIYAGKTGQGISTLLTVTGLGLATWENYDRLGIKNVKTIFFGALFTTFYIGNIYGTIFTVKISEDEYQQENNHRILFNLHIPLRTVFN